MNVLFILKVAKVINFTKKLNMKRNENKLNTFNSTQEITLRGTNRGVHSHHFHAGAASR